MDTRIRIIAEAITKEAEDSLKSLAALEKDLIDTTKALKLAQENTNGATNQQIGIIQRLESEISKLIDLRKKSSDTTEIAAYNRQIQSQEAELKKLTTVQQNSNVLSKEQNSQIQSITGSGNKSTEMFRNLATAMLGVFAIDRVIGYSKEIFNLATETDRLNITLQTVSKNNYEYGSSLQFLNQLSNDYGQNVNTLKQSYINFLASSESSNLSLKERQEIYGSVIKAGSALTLSNDNIQGSLVALSQMFSKGTVSSEELRGQLGERLPGAFGIMAKALGVNEKQLGKMLEQGEVLAKDALPKFAKALEEAYGEKATRNLLTATGANNRLTTSFINNVQAINENLGITKTYATAVNFLADNVNKVINAVTAASIVLALYTANKIRANVVSQIQLINLGKEVLAKQAASVVTLELTAAETAAAAATIRFNAAMASAPWGALMLAGVAVITMLLNYKDAQDELSKAQERVNGLVADSVSELVMQRNEFNTLSKSVLNTNLQEEERIKNLSIMKQKFPDQMKGINSLADAEAKLGMVIRLTNQDFVTRAKLLENEVKIKYNNELANKAIKEQILLENQLANASTNKTYMVTGTAGYVQTYDSEAEKIQKLIDKKKSLVISTQKSNESLAQYSETLTKKVNYDYDIQLKKAVEVDNKKVASNKKANDTTEKQIEASNKDIEKLKKESNEAIKKIDDDYAKEQFKAYEERAKIVNNAITTIQKNFSKVQLEGQTEHEENVKKSIDSLGNRITEFYDKNVAQEQLNSQSRILLENRTLSQLSNLKNSFRTNEEMAQRMFGKKISDLSIQEVKQLAKAIKENKELLDKFVTETLTTLAAQLDKVSAMITTKMAETSSLAEKEALGIGGKAIDAISSNLSGAAALMKGDLVGAAKGLLGYYKNLWDVTIGFNKTLDKIKREDFIQKFAESFGLIYKYSDAIKETFDGLVDSSVTLNESTLTGAEAQIQAQITAGNLIKSKYATAVEEENKLNETTIKNINEQYNESITKINLKYALLDAKENALYSKQSLAIKEAMNQDLFGFITNEDTKTSLYEDYNRKRSFIFDTFASQIRPITADMSDAEIAGINAAIAAREVQLSKVEDWLTSEFQSVFSNEEQKREAYSETDAIIAKGKDDLNDLSIKYAAEELQRTTDKNIEIAAADASLKLSLESQEQTHNDILVSLGIAKDTALADSFNKLKDVITSGYQSMQDAAKNAFNEGLITAAEFEAAMQRIIYLKALIDGTKQDVETRVNDKLKEKGLEGLLGYHDGTEFIQGEQGRDKILAKVEYGEAVLQSDLNKKRLEKGINRFQMVEYAINYKSLLSQGMPNLRINSNSIDKMEEHKAMQYLINMNVSPIIDELKEVRTALKSIPIQNFDLTEDGLSRYIKTQSSVTKLKAKRRK